MRRLTLILTLTLLLAASLLPAMDFDPDWFRSGILMTCFKMESIGRFDGKIEFTTQDGVVQTSMTSFNELAKKYNIIDLRQAHEYVKVPTWNDEGRYLQCIYRVVLADDKDMDSAVAELAKDPNVLFSEFETINRYKYLPNDPLVSQQYALDNMRCYEAWDYTTGNDVIIGIDDSGVKYNHPDLQANIWVNAAELPGITINWAAGTISGGDGIDNDGNLKVDDVIGWDFYNNDNNPYQNYVDNDHGTHVAGCAAAVFDNNEGGSGSAPGAQIMCLKGASNSSPSTGILNGYDMAKYAAENGAAVVNCSWGGPASSLNYANSIVNYVTNLGCLFVAAAGNDNLQHGNGYNDAPADCTWALCVAATDVNDIRTSFSDYGEPIDICAPGQAIVSTIINNNGYAAFDGTSMSSPLTSGVAAMVKALNPDLTAYELRERMMLTADYIYDVNPDYAPTQTTPAMLGTGRVNAYAATMYDKIPYLVVEDHSIEELDGDNDDVPNPGELIKLNLQLTNLMDPYTGLMWMTATDVTAKLRCDMPGVSVVDSVASFGSLGSGASNWNLTDPFTFETVSGLPSVPIPFEIYLTANATAEYPYAVSRYFNVNLSLVQPGWPVDVNGASQSSVAITDINSSSGKEIIFGDQSGRIHMVRPNGTEITNFPYQTTGTGIIGSLAMADVNGDGHMEIVANLNNSTIICLSRTGELLWSSPSGGILVGSPIIANVDMSGNPEVIAFTQNRYIVLLTSTGADYANFPVQLEGAMLANGAVGDLNGDNHLDIVVSTLTGYLHAISSADGQEMTGFPYTLGGASRNHPTLANLDSDNNPEILIPTYSNSQLFAINHDGSLLWQKNIDQQVKGGAVVADVNNDGEQEVIIIAYGGDVYVTNNLGVNLAGFPVNIGENVESTPVIARFDGNALSGIIFGDTNGKIHSLRSDGVESPNFPYTISGNIKVSPAVADLDNDGDMEIVFPNDAGFYSLDVKRNAVSYQWQFFMTNIQRSGNNYQTTPNVDPDTPGMVNALSGNYPNPFNPMTTISYSVKNAGPVRIEVYNLKGQKIRTLVSEAKAAGTHSIVWNGMDDTNMAVSSGVYFYTMQTGDYKSTRKMMLMK